MTVSDFSSYLRLLKYEKAAQFESNTIRSDKLSSCLLVLLWLLDVYNTKVTCVSSSISWASKDMVWSNMLAKDKAYSRDVHVMDKHPHLQPKMRTVLLDWLMEVSRRVTLEQN